MDCAIIVTLLLKLWDFFITTVFVRKRDLFWVMQIVRGEWRKGSKMRCTGSTFNEKVIKLWKCGSASSGGCTKLMRSSRIICEKTLPTNVVWVNKDACMNLSVEDSSDALNRIVNFLNTWKCLSSDIQKYCGQRDKVWQPDERIRGKGRYYGTN